MFDFDLQMRFWRNLTDVMLHSTQASLAAASAWQDQALASNGTPGAMASSRATSLTPSLTSQPPFSMMDWPWMAAFAPPTRTGAATWPLMWWLGTPPTAAANNPLAAMIPAPMMSAMMPWAGPMWQTAWAVGPQSPMAQMAKSMVPFWSWPGMTWACMQMPLTSMLMSSGMPYSVASPSAKAGTAAMDAADAAREQIDKMYSAYRSDGGHATAQLIVLPWTLAATFMKEASKPAA